jgi:hypothetical protein
MTIPWCIHDLFVTSVHSRDTGTSPNCQTGRSPGPEGLSPGGLVDDPELAAADLVVFATAGGLTVSLIHALGLAWDGLLNRAGSDIMLANSTFDADRFRTVFRGVGVDPDSVVGAALPFLGGAPYDPSAAAPSPPSWRAPVSRSLCTRA